MHFTGFCSNGTTAMTGEHKGLAQLPKDANPLVKSLHCMAHRLELAVKDGVDTVNSVAHIHVLVDAIYKVYSQSPKSRRAMRLSVTCQFSYCGFKVFNMLCVFSSLKVVTALLTDFPALYSHYVACSSECTNRNGQRIETNSRDWQTKFVSRNIFLAETSMIRDALATPSMLSLFLQSDSATVVTVMAHVQACIEKPQFSFIHIVNLYSIGVPLVNRSPVVEVMYGKTR